MQAPFNIFRYWGLMCGLLCNGILGALTAASISGAEIVTGPFRATFLAAGITLFGVFAGSALGARDVRQARQGKGWLSLAYAGVVLCLFLPFQLVILTLALFSRK